MILDRGYEGRTLGALFMNNRWFVCSLYLFSLCSAHDQVYVKLLNATPFFVNAVLNFCDRVKTGACSVQQVSIEAGKSIEVPVPYKSVFGGHEDFCFASLSITVPGVEPRNYRAGEEQISLLEVSPFSSDQFFRLGVQQVSIERDLRGGLGCDYKRSILAVEKPQFVIVNAGKLNVINSLVVPNLRIVKFIQ
jgi:hypothetical protein